MIYAVSGLPGSGKSTVARILSSLHNDAEIFRTDVIRQEIQETPDYSDEGRMQVYEEMYRRAVSTIRSGSKVVVLDATFTETEVRKRAVDLADSQKIKLMFVQVVVDDEVAKERLEARVDDASEAGFEQYLEYKEKFVPVEGAILIENNEGESELREKIYSVMMSEG